MNATLRFFTTASFVLAPSGTLLAAPPHSGIPDIPGIEPSDIALFGVAVLGVWFARRSMRIRARRRREAAAPPAND